MALAIPVPRLKAATRRVRVTRPTNTCEFARNVITVIDGALRETAPPSIVQFGRALEEMPGTGKTGELLFG